MIFSNGKCYFFNFHFLHRGLFQSIICHRFSILGSLMLERNSAAQQSTTLECCRLGCSVGCDDNCTALTSACTGSNTLFECTCCNAVCSSVKLMVVFGNSFEGISWLDLPPPLASLPRCPPSPYLTLEQSWNKSVKKINCPNLPLSEQNWQIIGTNSYGDI